MKSALPLALALAFLACARPVSSPPPLPDDYAAAKADYGTVHAVWEHPPFPGHTPEPGWKLVAADITFPPASEKFDLDDIDIFDAETSENFGSDPMIYRLTRDGRFVADNDAEVADQPEYRAVFLWSVPQKTRRVNFGYWGDLLYVKPFAIAKSGRHVPAPPGR